MDGLEIASSADIEAFRKCALISWIELYSTNSGLLSDYTSLLDGAVIHSIWQKVDPDPPHSPLQLNDITGMELTVGRTRNFDAIVQNLRDFYENELNQVILKLPDPFLIGFRPETKTGLEHIKLVITLVLGAAVQCPQKEEFIEKMKDLDVGTQHAIVEMIKQVTESRSLVLSLENMSAMPRDDFRKHLHVLERERNGFYDKWIAETTSINHMIPSTALSISDSLITNNCHLVDLKDRIRELRQELDEKTEINNEMSAELAQKQTRLEQLQSENQELFQEAKRASVFRDELDAMRERAEKADRLEAEVEKLREKLSATEFYKTRLEELREDNKVLMDTKQMLESQLERSRNRSDQIPLLESELSVCKQKLKDITADRQADQTKLAALIEENTQLQLTCQQQLAPKRDLNVSDCDLSLSQADVSLCDQLKNSVQAKLLALELENARLLGQIQEVNGSTGRLSHSSGYSSEIETELQSSRPKGVEALIEERNSLQTQLTDAQKKLQELSQENKIQGGKITSLKSKIEEMALSDKKAQELQRHVEKLAAQQTANETYINNLKKNLHVKSHALDVIKGNLVELGFDTNVFENEDAQITREPQKVFQSLDTCRNFLQLFSKSSSSETNGELVTKVSSLETKLQAMQKINLQLAANKEKLLSEVNSLRKHHELIEEDRNRLKKQRDRLNYERNNVLKDQDVLKTLIREIQEENKDLKTRATNLNRTTIEELAIVKTEHGKLKDDYSKLFAACEEYRSNYETLQNEYESVETENERLRGQINELAERIDRIVNSENGYGMLVERLQLLKDHNETLMDDRRQLMAHNATLLSEYRNLLSYSRQDRRDFSDAEQAYLDKINQLTMQKERLEIKIIDHYKTPDNAAKKKERSFLKRMKKASSEFLGRSSMKIDPSTSTDESCSTTPSKILEDCEAVTPLYDYGTTSRTNGSDETDTHSVADSESVSPKSDQTSTASPRTSTDIHSIDDEPGFADFQSTSEQAMGGDFDRSMEMIGLRRGNIFQDDLAEDEDDDDDALSIENFGALEPGCRKPIYVNEEEKLSE